MGDEMSRAAARGEQLVLPSSALFGSREEISAHYAMCDLVTCGLLFVVGVALMLSQRRSTANLKNSRYYYPAESGKPHLRLCSSQSAGIAPVSLV